MLAPRVGIDEDRVLRDGAELRSRALLERTLRSLGIDTDERWLLERTLRSELARGEEERLLAVPEERSEPRERLVTDEREVDPLRSDSLTRLDRLDEDCGDSVAARLRDSARAGALPLIVRPRSRATEARSDPRPATRASRPPSEAERVAARESLRPESRTSATRSEREDERVADCALRSNCTLERRSAAQSRRSERETARPLFLDVALAEAGRLLSTKRVCSTRPR